MKITRSIDTKYSLWVCHEIGFNYFKIRTLFTKNEEEFQNLYSVCVDNAINKYTDKNEIINKYTYNPSNIIDITLSGILQSIWRGTYCIISYSKGTFIVIPYSWNYYLVIEPIFSIVNQFNNKNLCEYINNKYKYEILDIIQYLNT